LLRGPIPDNDRRQLGVASTHSRFEGFDRLRSVKSGYRPTGISSVKRSLGACGKLTLACREGQPWLKE
jgi:hypothetical protein